MQFGVATFYYAERHKVKNWIWLSYDYLMYLYDYLMYLYKNGLIWLFANKQKYSKFILKCFQIAKCSAICRFNFYNFRRQFFF